MSIAGTRIHRSLVDFAYDNTDVYDRGSFTSAHAHSASGWRSHGHGSSEPNDSKTLASGHTVPKVNNPSGSLFNPSNGMEVTVAIHMAYEEYQTPTSIHSGSVVSGEEQSGKKPTGLGLDDDVEKMAY
jgi:hypothetical protein